MADKIEEEERRSLAHAEVTEALAGDTLETEFLRLEAGDGGADVESKLAALKQEMGLLPSGEPEEPKQLGAGDRGKGFQDAEVEEVPPEEAENIPEAELIEEFDRLEERSADS
jgi:hypothetical protein